MLVAVPDRAVVCLPSALRKQVSTYAKENEELRSQADALKEEIATLSERQNTSESAVDNRRKNRNNVEDIDMDNSLQHDRTEEAEKNFKDDTASSSRQDEAVLRKENESLNEQILELRDELSALKDEALQLKKERKTFKKQWEADLERLESRLKQRWEKERKRLIAEKEDLAARCE